MSSTALARFNPSQPGAAGMKAAATGLLVAMAALFAVTRLFEPAYPWLGWVKAFAEAAMVGGLADWFAVTALFRHPLGLPIPHTAIIPRNKDRIGEALANFLKENFLIAPVVARRRIRCPRARSSSAARSASGVAPHRCARSMPSRSGSRHSVRRPARRSAAPRSTRASARQSRLGDGVSAATAWWRRSRPCSPP